MNCDQSISFLPDVIVKGLRSKVRNELGDKLKKVEFNVYASNVLLYEIEIENEDELPVFVRNYMNEHIVVSGSHSDVRIYTSGNLVCENNYGSDCNGYVWIYISKD